MSNLSPEDQQAFDALRAAVMEALERKRRLGEYAVVWRDGRAARIEPDEHTLPDHAAPRRSGA